MKLNTNYFEKPIIIEENKINVIVIENSIYFSKFLTELNDDINNSTKNFYFSHNLEELSLSKTSILIIDVFNFSINKVVINKIQKLIENNLSNDSILLEQFRVLNGQIFSFLDELLSDFIIDLNIDDNYSISSLLKMANLKVQEECINVFDKINNIIKILGCLDLYKIIFFVNLKSFLNENQIKEIYKLANYNKINLVLIENKQSFKTSEEIYNILDEDLCEII